MNSLGEDCKELKHDYDTCFNNWFADKFLKGVTDESMCAPIFKVYQQCVKNAMKDQHLEMKEIEVTHLGSAKEFHAPGESTSNSKASSSS